MDEKLRNEILEDCLAHHGIKGQQWGVRNGPPYPLSRSSHLQSKKSNLEKSLDKPRSYKYNKLVGNEYVEKAAATAIVTLTYAAIMQGYLTVNNLIKRKNERIDNKNVTSESDLPKKKKMGTISDDVNATNPNKGHDGFVQNCMYCSSTYDLRRRGYDVTANVRNAGGRTKEFEEWYDGAKVETIKGRGKKAQYALKDWFDNQPEGSRGSVNGFGSFGGHSIAYEIKNGKCLLLDGQTGKTWDFNAFTNAFNQKYHVVRLDNCQPNWEKIGEVINPESLQKGD